MGQNPPRSVEIIFLAETKEIIVLGLSINRPMHALPIDSSTGQGMHFIDGIFVEPFV